jgi:hypothetical protein
MLTAARRVLLDCRVAYELLELESDDARFRVLWVGAVALLRSVGHVLQKVDARQGQAYEEAINRAWQRWKTDREGNAIFWNFIEQERNNVLKQYDIGLLEEPIDLVEQPGKVHHRLGDNLFRPIAEGRFAGEDGRDLVEQAISWWESQLCVIESQTESTRRADRA